MLAVAGWWRLLVISCGEWAKYLCSVVTRAASVHVRVLKILDGHLRFSSEWSTQRFHSFIHTTSPTLAPVPEINQSIQWILIPYVTIGLVLLTHYADDIRSSSLFIKPHSLVRLPSQHLWLHGIQNANTRNNNDGHKKKKGVCRDCHWHDSDSDWRALLPPLPARRSPVLIPWLFHHQFSFVECSHSTSLHHR